MASDRDIRLLQAWLDAGSPTTDAGVPILDDDVWPDLPYPDIHVAVSPEAVDEVMAIAPPDPDITGGELTTGYVSDMAEGPCEPPPGYHVDHGELTGHWYVRIDAPNRCQSREDAVAACRAHRDAVLASARQPWERQRDEAHRRLDGAGVAPGPIDVRIGQLLASATREPQSRIEELGEITVAKDEDLGLLRQKLGRAHENNNTLRGHIAKLEQGARPQGGGAPPAGWKDCIASANAETLRACEHSDGRVAWLELHCLAASRPQGGDAELLEPLWALQRRWSEREHRRGSAVGIGGHSVSSELARVLRSLAPRPPVGGEPAVAPGFVVETEDGGWWVARTAVPARAYRKSSAEAEEASHVLRKHLVRSLAEPVSLPEPQRDLERLLHVAWGQAKAAEYDKDTWKSLQAAVLGRRDRPVSLPEGARLPDGWEPGIEVPKHTHPQPHHRFPVSAECKALRRWSAIGPDGLVYQDSGACRPPEVAVWLRERWALLTRVEGSNG